MRKLDSILQAYSLQELDFSCIPIQTGHINESYQLVSRQSKTSYFLQKINVDIFKQAEDLMKNIERCLQAQHQNPMTSLVPLQLLYTSKNQSYFVDDSNQYWRIYHYLEDFFSANTDLSDKTSARIGHALGSFLTQMRHEPLEDYHPIIAQFHNIRVRLKNLDEAIGMNAHHRLSEVQDLLNIVRDLRFELLLIQDQIDQHKVPTRITHNDTKASNFMIHPSSDKVALVDLDTVMPSSLLFDFGDACRSLISYHEEDEDNGAFPALNWMYYRSFKASFLDTTSDWILESEKDLLALSCVLLPFLMGIRFLTDYLSGDVYFKIKTERQNYFRAKNQLTLAKEIYRFRHEL